MKSSRLKSIKIFNLSVSSANAAIILFVIICGSFKVDFANWSLPTSSTKGEGGFFPYGFDGVIKATGICFFAFIGCDGISTVREEIKNPKRSILISISLTILISFLFYAGILVVLTTIAPYYDLVS